MAGGRGGPEQEELHFPAGRGVCDSGHFLPAASGVVVLVSGPGCEWRRRSRLGRSMDLDGRWRSLPSGPSLKHLTDPSYAIPPEQQKAALQDLTRAHVDSFNYAVLEGLSHAVQVSGAPSAPEPYRRPEWARRVPAVEEVAGRPLYGFKQ